MDKQRTVQLLDDTFNSYFDVNKYTLFIKELFNNFVINKRSWKVWQEYLDYIDSYQLLGSYKQNKDVIDVLVVKLKRTSSRDRARTMQRNFVAKYLSNTEKNAALVAFYGDDPQDWRFSFVKMEYKFNKDDSGKVKISKELTPAKRYSFLVGVNEPNHTCRSQFLKLVMEEEVNPTLSDIETAFSIDNVTKEFFTEYKELFLNLEESLRKVIKKDQKVRDEFDKKNISTVDFSKKLLGQIVFIYFLQKKGWLGVDVDTDWGGGPKNFMRRLFGDKKKGLKPLVPYTNFFNEILEPLFYEALATDRGADDHYYRLFKCKIPFLNGGLFEPLNEYNWSSTDITLDNSIFEKILGTFDRFNFTVKEDEPLEKEVAIDPEMLGKVFENLLEVKDRKSKGAFYTPREIVHYMCQQSLINYLETNSSIPRKDIEMFIQLGELSISNDQRILSQIDSIHDRLRKGIIDSKSFENELKKLLDDIKLPRAIVDQRANIDKLLKEIKIIDPAVGSGAFPIGMLNEIIKLRSILTIFYEKDKQKERTDSNLKREIIENCLYGVDIEPSAVDITKLRFWLSLIVDELDIKNIRPLPNLDHKIMCGNSLLEEFEGIKLFDERLLGDVKKDVSFEIKQIQDELDKLNSEKGEIARGKKTGKTLKQIDREIKKLEKEKKNILSSPKDKTRNMTLDEALQNRIKMSQRKLKELKSLQEKFFNEQNRTSKKKLRTDIEKIEWELIEETLKEQGNENAMQKLEQYKKNKSKPFFLWKLYFAEVFQRENPGFDVVIANPPYVRYESLREDKEALRRNYLTYTTSADIYVYFIELSYKIARVSGFVSLITSNKYLRAKYGQQLRQFLMTNTKLVSICNFDDFRVFDSATVFSSILNLEKNDNPNEAFVFCNFKLDYQKNEPLYRYIDNNQITLSQSNLLDSGFVFANKEHLSIYDKIESLGTPLVSKGYKIVRGLTIGCNAAFIIDKSVRNKLISLDSTSNAVIKPLLRGRDIKKYSLEQKLFVIIIPTGWTKKQSNMDLTMPQAEKVFESRYPAIHNHLLDIGNKILSNDIKSKGKGLFERDDQGDFWWELRNCDYYDEFEKEKIVWLEISKSSNFCYDTGSNYLTNSAYMLLGKNQKSILAILNSKLICFYFPHISVQIAGQRRRYTQQYVEKIPIPDLNKNTILKLNEYVDTINSLTQVKDFTSKGPLFRKYQSLLKKIDQLVYNIYKLTPTEIEVVEDFIEND